MFFNNQKDKRFKFIRDVADLVTTIIIIAGLSVAAIVAIGGITIATKDNAKKSADCIANHSAFNKTTDINDDCKGEKDSNESNNEDNGNGNQEEESDDWINIKPYFEEEELAIWINNNNRYDDYYYEELTPGKEWKISIPIKYLPMLELSDFDSIQGLPDSAKNTYIAFSNVETLNLYAYRHDYHSNEYKKEEKIMSDYYGKINEYLDKLEENGGLLPDESITMPETEEEVLKFQEEYMRMYGEMDNIIFNKSEDFYARNADKILEDCKIIGGNDAEIKPGIVLPADQFYNPITENHKVCTFTVVTNDPYYSPKAHLWKLYYSDMGTIHYPIGIEPIL